MKIEITEESVIIKHDTKKEVRQKPKIESPGYRDILFFNDIVIKFDVPSRGHFGKQCQVEAEKYQEIEEEDKKYFATVLDFGDGWIAQERVFFCKPDTMYRKNYENYEIAKNILDVLSRKYNLWDLHDENWGIKENGEPIIFDYGVSP